jgi:Polysulphide reductase, NrfD
VNGEHRWDGTLEHGGEPAELASEHEPPPRTAGRPSGWPTTTPERATSARRSGRTASQGRGRRPSRGAPVALARRGFGAARWSFLYKARDTGYASTEPAPGQVAAANRRMRAAPVPDVRGPFIKAPVWTWQVPAYFWVGGMASGSGFAALACDVAGDHRSAAIARRVALGAVAPAPLLLIGDLGRPERFLNMLRIFKPRSPMNMGAWCLVGFSGSAALAVGADLARRPKPARALGALTSLLGGYLCSYTGVLLASTAVPVWARSRSLLGPIFVATATATGAAATRLALVARGLPDDHPTGKALGTIETAAMLSELSLSAINERQLGQAAESLRRGRPGLLFASPNPPSCRGSPRDCWRAERDRGPTTSRASSIWLRASRTASPGSREEGRRRHTTRRSPRWVAVVSPSRMSSRVHAAPARRPSSGPRCRCTVSPEPGARRRGGPASRSNGWSDPDGSPGPGDVRPSLR